MNSRYPVYCSAPCLVCSSLGYKRTASWLGAQTTHAKKHQQHFASPDCLSIQPRKLDCIQSDLKVSPPEQFGQLHLGNGMLDGPYPWVHKDLCHLIEIRDFMNKSQKGISKPLVSGKLYRLYVTLITSKHSQVALLVQGKL